MSKGSVLGWIVEKLLMREPDRHLTDLPHPVMETLEIYLDKDEEILSILRTFRAIYKAPSWIESNQYYHAWMVTTSKRILVLKNSPKFKLFRDIPITAIARTLYEVGEEEYKITLESPGRTDILEFYGLATEHCPEMRRLLDQLTAPRGSHTAEAKLNYCPHCGAPIKIRANFCHECGKKLLA